LDLPSQAVEFLLSGFKPHIRILSEKIKPYRHAVTRTDGKCMKELGGDFRYLPASTGGFMAASVMHRLAVELRPVFGGLLAPRRKTPVIALAVVELMIDVPVEMILSVEPRSRPDEYSA
jgi:hypothetical protein